MIKGGTGGAKTQSGLVFEKKIDIVKLFRRIKGYKISKNEIYLNGNKVAECYKKREFETKFLNPRGVYMHRILSKGLQPDQAVFVLSKNKVYIIEIKFQKVGGSVDEKLQTCDFKKKQYEKLVSPLRYAVEYVYILNKWFKKEEYRDTLQYVRAVGCRYFFGDEGMPLSFLGLPEGNR